MTMDAAVAACPACGQIHAGDMPELAFRRPDAVEALEPDERESDVQESDYFCALRGEHYFVSTVLALPVAGRGDYTLRVWAEMDEDNFYRVLAFWEDEGREDRPTFDAVLANAIPGLPETVGLAATLTIVGPAQRPKLRIVDASHPLHAEQAAGITPHRASAYAALIDGNRCVDAPTVTPPADD